MAAAVLVLAGCTSTASYDERMAYLHKVAQQGVDTHNLLYSQEAPRIDGKRCTDAWAGLKKPDEFPHDISGNGNISQEWADQIQQFFVDSCVSGKPKPVPGAAPPTPTTSVPSPTTS